jgi:hypothetical protein
LFESIVPDAAQVTVRPFGAGRGRGGRQGEVARLRLSAEPQALPTAVGERA